MWATQTSFMRLKSHICPHLGAVSGDMQDCQIGESASKQLSFSFCLPLSRCRRGATTKCRDVVLGEGADG